MHDALAAPPPTRVSPPARVLHDRSTIAGVARTRLVSGKSDDAAIPTNGVETGDRRSRRVPVCHGLSGARSVRKRLVGLVSAAAWVVVLTGCAHRVHDATVAWQAPSPPPGRSRPASSQTVAVSIPANVVVQAGLRESVQDALSCSPMLRRQIQRVAQYPSLRVTVQVATAVHLGVSRARSRIASIEDVLHARIELGGVDHDVLELLSHELEHVIEYLDGVRLTTAPLRGVQRDVHGAAETVRAQRVGLAAAAECRQLSPQAVAP